MSREHVPTSEIAKKIRVFIKEKKKTGDIPKGMKFSTRSSYFSGGSSIDVKIVDVPLDFNVYDRNTCSFLNERNEDTFFCEFSGELKKVMGTVKEFDDKYNHYDIDIQTDYFNVGHWFSIELDYDLARDRRKKIFDESGGSFPIRPY